MKHVLASSCRCWLKRLPHSFTDSLVQINGRGYWIAPLESDVSRTLQPRAWNYLHHTRQEDRDALSVHCIFSIRGSSAVQWGSAQQTIDIWHNIYFRSHLIKETIVQSFLISNPKTHRVLQVKHMKCIHQHVRP